MTDDVRYDTLTKRIDSEKELFGTLAARLKEVAADMKEKYNIPAIDERMDEYVLCLNQFHDFAPKETKAQSGVHRVLDELIAVGREGETDEFTRLERPSFIDTDPFLVKLYQEKDLRQDHLDLYAAKQLFCAINLARVAKDKGPKAHRILYDILADEVIKLADGTFTNPKMLAEQASIRGEVAFFRGLNRGVENQKLDAHNDLIPYFQEAVDQYEKAVKYDPKNKDLQEKLRKNKWLLAGAKEE